MKQTDWDDLRVFLAFVRGENTRQAGRLAGVSHSTVARRLDQLEQRLDVKLLQREATGYQLTAAGEEVFAAAERVESEFDAVSRRLLGQERQLAGTLRITMVDVLATHLLMPDIASFSDEYPDIQIELTIGYEPADLGRREADIALRVTAHPPEDLIGREVGGLANAAYVSASYRHTHDLDDPDDASWIGFGDSGRFHTQVRNSVYAHLPVRGRYDSIGVQVAAARANLGIAYLPCIVGDLEPELVRVDEPSSFKRSPIWILRHPDTRETARLKVFVDFLTDAVRAHYARLEGHFS